MSTDLFDPHARSPEQPDRDAGAREELRRFLARSRGEPGSPLHDRMVLPSSPTLRERTELRAAARVFLEPRGSRDFAAEIAAVEALHRARDEEDLIPVATSALNEAWGDHLLPTDQAAAAERYERALRGYQQFASWATSGGEGVARMLDVKRLLGKLGRPAPARRKLP